MLNLAHRTDRWEQIVKEFEGKCKLIKADCVMVEDESLTNVKRRYHGVAYTHIQLIKDAKARGDKTLLILEDDCTLADKTSWGKWLKIKNWLDNNMDKWEMFNGGIVSPGHIEKIVSIDNLNIIKSAGGGGAHFLYINVDKSYQYILDWVIDKQDIDLYYSETFNYWISYPLLAVQRNGYSDIQEQKLIWDYRVFSTRKSLEKMIESYLYKEKTYRNRS